MPPAFLSTSWFQYLGPKQQRLVVLAYQLLDRERAQKTQFVDYSFIVFPMSKAYEGFLKLYFYNLELIDAETFYGKRFRVGRALNPDVHRRQRDKDWIYDDLEQHCGPEVTRELWDTWLECRNRIFHFFPNADRVLSLNQAGQYLDRISAAIQAAVECIHGAAVMDHLENRDSAAHLV